MAASIERIKTLKKTYLGDEEKNPNMNLVERFSDLVNRPVRAITLPIQAATEAIKGAPEERLKELGGAASDVLSPISIGKSLIMGARPPKEVSKTTTQVLEGLGVPELGSAEVPFSTGKKKSIRGLVRQKDVGQISQPELQSEIKQSTKKPERTKITGRDILGFAGDVLADPTTYISAGSAPFVKKGIVKGAQKSLTKDLIEKEIKDLSKQISLKKSPKKGVSFITDVKRKLIDFASPIEDALSSAEKKSKFKILPEFDIRAQIDKTLRAPSLAGQFVKDQGLEQIIREVPDLDILNQYALARHAKTLRKKGIETGRNINLDEAILVKYGKEYEPAAQALTNYSHKLLDYGSESGLFSKELADYLKKEYPTYVPFKRVFDELEKVDFSPSRKQIANLGSQNIVKKIKGSKRLIDNPIDSLLEKTNDVFILGERNKAAKMLASYKELPGFADLIKEIPKGEKRANTISFLDNGVKKTLETTPEIAQAAKSLNVQQLGTLQKILAAPTRLARLGITGINIPFIARNVPRDFVTAVVNSKNPIATMANPNVFMRSLANTIKRDKLYDDFIRSGAGGTTFDISRSQIGKTVKKIRAGRSGKDKIKYLVKNPSDLFRAVEDIIGRSEEFTRMAQFQGTKSALIKKGMPPERATIEAAKAARENTANFMRRGEWGTMLNSMILYLNAGIQGSRALVRSFKRQPIQTGAKIATVVFTPVAMTTAYNLSDPKRARIYEDIPDYEKENNLILIGPNAKKDKTGSYGGVIKIPLPPGISNLAIPVRRQIEGLNKADPETALDIVNSFIGATTPFELDMRKTVSTLTPQAIKPVIEQMQNKVLFTGKPIVPYYLEKKKPEKQFYKWTSGTAKKVGKATGSSPLRLEALGKGYLGSIFPQLLNMSDEALSKMGVIKDSEIGGQSIPEALERSFLKVWGGRQKQLKKDKEKVIRFKKYYKKSSSNTKGSKADRIKLLQERLKRRSQ